MQTKCKQCSKDISNLKGNFYLNDGTFCYECKAYVTDTAGVKHDQGKPDFSHMTWELMEVHARVRMFGATKYERDNWHKGFKITRSLAAALRHIFKFLSGEDNDQESGLSHLGHAVCCIEHALHDHLYRKHNDDRRKPSSGV